MVHTSTLATTDVATMPRGGPDASWIDRHLSTNRPEYTDRYDVSDETKQYVITALDRLGTRTGAHRTIAQMALDCVAGIDEPRVLELGAGHGRLSEHILDLHPKARVTISDLDPKSVANVAGKPLGRIARVTTKVLDATAIDEPDNSFDVVLLANAFHHLPPETAARAIAEATRVGRTFLVVDLKRMSPLRLILSPLVGLAVMSVMVHPWAATLAVWHDSTISGLRAYSPAAFRALAHAADPTLQVDLRPVRRGQPGTIGVAFSRAGGRRRT